MQSVSSLGISTVLRIWKLPREEILNIPITMFYGNYIPIKLE